VATAEGTSFPFEREEGVGAIFGGAVVLHAAGVLQRRLNETLLTASK
jgi:hypothetical protein